MALSDLAKEQNEYEIQRDIFSWMEAAVRKYPNLDLAYSTASGVRLPVGLMMKCKRVGVIKKGLPDIVIPIPKGKYHGMYIELKKDKGSYPSDEQKLFIKRLNDLGYYAIISKGFQNTINEIEKYLSL